MQLLNGWLSFLIVSVKVDIGIVDGFHIPKDNIRRRNTLK